MSTGAFIVIGIAGEFIRMRMHRVVVAILAVLRVAVALVPGVLMMPERHALSGRDGCQALERDGQGQQSDSE
jgi:hypothetical protein